MDWHASAAAAFAGLVGYLYATEPSREFVTFRPCGYIEVDLSADSPFGEIFTLAPNFTRFDVRPERVTGLGRVETGPKSVVCTILWLGPEHQAVLGSIDEVKAKILQ